LSFTFDLGSVINLQEDYVDQSHKGLLWLIGKTIMSSMGQAIVWSI
jgi:hypothetical protein|tara:strand:- start:162 stop:299 length:138 start_codon:yes stop_codon:yes gene_type:complete